jgi:hypothetical protein
LKYLLLLSLALSTSAFAIDFTRVTGTFEVADNVAVVGSDTVADAAFGSFNLYQDKSRVPASAETEVEKATVGINDVTGSFQ